MNISEKDNESFLVCLCDFCSWLPRRVPDAGSNNQLALIDQEGLMLNGHTSNSQWSCFSQGGLHFLWVARTFLAKCPLHLSRLSHFLNSQLLAHFQVDPVLLQTLLTTKALNDTVMQTSLSCDCGFVWLSTGLWKWTWAEREFCQTSRPQDHQGMSHISIWLHHWLSTQFYSSLKWLLCVGARRKRDGGINLYCFTFGNYYTCLITCGSFNYTQILFVYFSSASSSIVSDILHHPAHSALAHLSVDHRPPGWQEAAAGAEEYHIQDLHTDPWGRWCNVDVICRYCCPGLGGFWSRVRFPVRHRTRSLQPT